MAPLIYDYQAVACRRFLMKLPDTSKNFQAVKKCK